MKLCAVNSAYCSADVDVLTFVNVEVEYLAGDGTKVESSEDWVKLALHGSGWGHGVGLCQIGAAVMATQGYDYRQILSHYYPGAMLEKQSE